MFNFILDKEFFDENVFYSLTSIEFDYCNLRSFKDDTFSDLYQLKKINFYLENMESFFKGSPDNKWMMSLNTGVTVDLSDPDDIDAYLEDTFLVIFNNRIEDQDYLYPDEDLSFFRQFPHEKVKYIFYIFETIFSS